MNDKEDFKSITPEKFQKLDKQLEHLQKKEITSTLGNPTEEEIDPLDIKDHNHLNPHTKKSRRGTKSPSKAVKEKVTVVQSSSTRPVDPKFKQSKKLEISKSGDPGIILAEPVVPPNSDFGNLILYNSDGKPYVDVNKLVYNPKERVKKELKERCSWYFADYVFILSNFISLACSSYVLFIGLAAITWAPSIGSVNDAEGPIQSIILKSTSDFTPETFGAILITTAVLNGINVLSGIFSCIYGYKILLAQHVVVDISILGTQIGCAAIMITKGRCDSDDLVDFQENLEALIRNFTNLDDSTDLVDDEYKNPLAANKLNDIQISMQCCGASNWTDFLNPDVLQSEELIDSLDDKENVFPFSCCKAWWVRNINCADGVHLWAHPLVDMETAKKFRERIHQGGCVGTISLACTRLLFLMGTGVIFNGTINGILIGLETFAVVLQIRSLNTMLRELKSSKEIQPGDRGYNIDNDNEESLSSLSALVTSTSSYDKTRSALLRGAKTLDAIKSIMALPTENEIQYIKSRSDFSKFEKLTKRTQIGKMMNQAKSSVFIPIHDEVQLEALPQVKRRNSKLLKKPEVFETTVAEIEQTSLRDFGHGKKKKRKKSKKHKRKPPQIEVTTIEYTVRPISVPSHRVKRKKRKKRHHDNPPPQEDERDPGIPGPSFPETTNDDPPPQDPSSLNQELGSALEETSTTHRDHPSKRKRKKKKRTPDPATSHRKR